MIKVKGNGISNEIWADFQAKFHFYEVAKATGEYSYFVKFKPEHYGNFDLIEEFTNTLNKLPEVMETNTTIWRPLLSAQEA